jgi:hypothetical protein
VTKKNPKPNAAKPEYQLTAQEQTVLRKFFDRKNASPSPRLKIHKEKLPTILPDHPDEAVGLVLLMEALGIADVDFLNGLLRQMANAGTQGREIDEGALNFMASFVKGIKPRDEIEAMLAAQMAAVHMATMTFARRLAHVENIPQQDSAERAFNKLARTFATQMEALKRYRTGGEQKVTVQHVSVSEGGQAIVGNVTQAARETARDKAPPPALPDSRTPTMPIAGERTSTAVPLKRKASK